MRTKREKIFYYEDNERCEKARDGYMNVNKYVYACIYYKGVFCVGVVIISLFLFLREFIRVKWSENENGGRD